MLRFSEGTNASENPSSLVDDLFRDSFFHVVILQTFITYFLPGVVLTAGDAKLSKT